MDKEMTHALSECATDDLVKKHVLMVKRIAYHLLGRLPRSIQLDDLVQAGMEGLLLAAMSYDHSKGASFETYAGIRIRGHMLDEIRRNDWVPRSVHRQARMIAAAVKTVESRLNREARDHEIAEELGIALSAYHDMLHEANGAHLYGFDDIGVTDDSLESQDESLAMEPQGEVLRADMKHRISEIIESLPQNERLVLSLYYEHELNLKEIGEILGVSESRVSQIHGQATHRIKARYQHEL